MRRAVRPAVRVVLTLFVAALLGGLILLLQSGETQPIDAAVALSFVPYRAGWLIELFLYITTLGSDVALWTMMAAVTVYLWFTGHTKLLVPLWTTFIGTELTTWGLKFALGRARPAFLPDVASAISPSFPSAHTAGSTAVLGFIAYAVTPYSASQRARFGVQSGAVLGIALIALSRLFLNVHYLTDVTGGFLVGLLWLLLSTSRPLNWRRAGA